MKKLLGGTALIVALASSAFAYDDPYREQRQQLEAGQRDLEQQRARMQREVDRQRIQQLEQQQQEQQDQIDRLNRQRKERNIWGQ